MHSAEPKNSLACSSLAIFLHDLNKESCIRETITLGHFGHWGQNFHGEVVGFFSEARAVVFFLNILNWSIEEVLGGGVIILICLDDTKTLLTTQKQSR